MRQSTLEELPEVHWSRYIPDEQWKVYLRVIEGAERAQIPFAIGGGFAFSHYADRWRNTKDMDFYVVPGNRDRMIRVVEDAGLVDYYEVSGYDRAWIFRSHNRQGVIVDIMWQMANYRAQVDDAWLARGELVNVRGIMLRLLPVEELLWTKLYILQRDRCDWGDLLNILFNRGRAIDWGHLLENVGEDRRVLAGLLEIFAWACPERAAELPATLWRLLRIEPPRGGSGAPEVDGRHIRLLDSRDWFGPRAPMLPQVAPCDREEGQS